MAKEMLMQALGLKLYIGAHDIIKVKGMQKEVAHVQMQLLKDRHKIGSYHVCNVTAALHASKCQHLNTYNYIQYYYLHYPRPSQEVYSSIMQLTCRTSGVEIELANFWRKRVVCL